MLPLLDVRVAEAGVACKNNTRTKDVGRPRVRTPATVGIAGTGRDVDAFEELRRCSCRTRPDVGLRMPRWLGGDGSIRARNACGPADLDRAGNLRPAKCCAWAPGPPRAATHH